MGEHPLQEEFLQEWSRDQRLKFERTRLRLITAGQFENLMDALGVSRAELANRISKSKAWISKMLSGRQNLRLDTLAEVAWALGVRTNVELVEADRRGSPAANDPDLPHWIERKGEIEIRSSSERNIVAEVPELSTSDSMATAETEQGYLFARFMAPTRVKSILFSNVYVHPIGIAFSGPPEHGPLDRDEASTIAIVGHVEPSHKYDSQRTKMYIDFVLPKGASE